MGEAHGNELHQGVEEDQEDEEGEEGREGEELPSYLQRGIHLGRMDRKVGGRFRGRGHGWG